MGYKLLILRALKIKCITFINFHTLVVLINSVVVYNNNIITV